MRKRELYVFNGASRAAAYGIGTYIEQLANALKNTEWRLNIVYLYAAGDEVEITEKESCRLITIPFSARNDSNAKQCYARMVAFILKDITAENVQTEYIFHLNFMKDSYFVRCLKRHFRCKILLLCHYTSWSFALSGDYSKLKKIINHSNKGAITEVEKSILNTFREDVKMINRVDCFVCVAKHTLATYSESGSIQAKKTVVIPNALEDVYRLLSNDEKSRLRKKYFIGENTKIILFAGRLDDVKGLAYLIKAYKNVLATFPDSYLIIAGEGRINTWLKESANVWSRILFTGKLNKDSLYEFYQIADMGVVCSLHEEFGFVAIEMMMHALPVLVTKTGGLNEIVEDGISGLKVPIRTVKGQRQVDIKLLEEKMKFLLNNPVYAQELGENGRKRFIEKYALSTFKEKMLDLYANLT